MSPRREEIKALSDQPDLVTEQPMRGTLAGRRLGGLRSIKTHRMGNSGFKILRKIPAPRKSSSLAELMGALMGDGHMSEYQVSLTTNAETDRFHADHIAYLLHLQFGGRVSITKKKDCNAVTVLLSSKSASLHLERLGMPRGNKLKVGLRPPDWILKNNSFTTAFIRGLVDTDGCVYEDRHRINGKDYSSLCIAFTSASEPMLNFVHTTLSERGFTPRKWGRHIRLRRRKDVLRYTKEIGFSNPKHADKIRV